MKKQFKSLAITLFLPLVFYTVGFGSSQTTTDESKVESIVGTWKFISLVAESTEGDVFYPYGKKMYGQLMYDDQGNMSFLGMRSDREEFTSGDIYISTAQEIREAFESFDAYCGTYKVDSRKKTITHYVQGSRFPNWKGSKQVRHYELSGSKLILTANLRFKNKKWQLKAVLIRQQQKTEKEPLYDRKLVKGFVEMWNEKDLKKIDTIFTNDCIYEDVPGLEKYQGQAEVKASLQEDFTWCSDLVMEVVSHTVSISGATIEWVWKGKQTGDIKGLIRATGKSFKVRGVSILEFKNGLIHRVSDYYDAGGFLYQLGVKFVFPQPNTFE